MNIYVGAEDGANLCMVASVQLELQQSCIELLRRESRSRTIEAGSNLLHIRSCSSSNGSVDDRPAHAVDIHSICSLSQCILEPYFASIFKRHNNGCDMPSSSVLTGRPSDSTKRNPQSKNLEILEFDPNILLI